MSSDRLLPPHGSGSSPSLAAAADTPDTSRSVLDYEESSSAADPLLGGVHPARELGDMGKTKDDTSIGSAQEEIDHLEVAPIRHGGAVWESRQTYGPAGTGLLTSLSYLDSPEQNH